MLKHYINRKKELFFANLLINNKINLLSLILDCYFLILFCKYSTYIIYEYNNI